MMCCAGGAVRGCSCLNCTNNVECTIILIGAVETTAPPKNAQLYQLVQLLLWQAAKPNAARIN